ncbi:MAG: hypothetical protein GY845_18200 [Planctomycetes bacterium]|nr:hypothetical protein [Planctomycetota bacterium]
MTNNYVLVVCIAIVMTVSFFGPMVGLSTSSDQAVSPLTEHAIEVLEAEGYDIPDSARTGLPDAKVEPPEIGGWDAAWDLMKWAFQSGDFLFGLMTFQVEGVPYWMGMFIFLPMGYIMIYLCLKLARGGT